VSLRARDTEIATRGRIYGLITRGDNALAQGQYLEAANAFHVARHELIVSAVPDTQLCKELEKLAHEALARFQQAAQELSR
jgi:hypothetical protein